MRPLANPLPCRCRRTLRTAGIWLAIWIVPLILVALIFGREHVLTDIAVFFSKLAVVTFGGAYSVLAYMAQQAVETYGWLSPGEMLDGLGLAETTPGPLILVTEFVGFLAGYRLGGEPALAFGLLGAAVTLWATFAPCFLWIFVGAPYVERLGRNPKLAGALASVTAAVVGVILNLSVWFALHVFFAKVDVVRSGPLLLSVPDPSTLDVKAVLLAGLAAISAAQVEVRHCRDARRNRRDGARLVAAIRSSLVAGSPKVHERRPYPGAAAVGIHSCERRPHPSAAARINLGEGGPHIVAALAVVAGRVLVPHRLHERGAGRLIGDNRTRQR